jgi:hypothetical protein
MLHFETLDLPEQAADFSLLRRQSAITAKSMAVIIFCLFELTTEYLSSNT